MKDSLFSDLPGPSEPATTPSRKWLPYVAVAVGLIAIVAVVPLLGPSTKSTQSDDEEVDPVEVADREERRLLEQLAQVSISPDRLGVDTNESTLAEELNRWWSVYGPGEADGGSFGDAHLAPLLELLGEDASRLAMADSFSRKDVAHLATAKSLLAAGMAITTGLESDHEKATELFYFVVRNIQLVEGDSLPTTFPHQTLLWGRGRGEDRIWTFVELLRQRRIDAFLVIPAEGESGHPLVAVALDEGLLLFDPIWGLPIPSLAEDIGDTALPMVAATYSEALQNDEVFRQLDGPETPYPWNAEALRRVQFLVVGSDATFSPRMEALQGKLESQFSFIVFDGWNSSAFREVSLKQRIESVVDPLEDVECSISAWSYPLVQAATYDTENGLDGTLLEERALRLNAPTVLYRDIDENQQLIERHVPATRTLQLVRSQHLQADFDEAMRGYLPMRNSYKQNPRSENREAAEVAVFWSAICQFELGYEELSITGFENYLREYQNGHFAVSAHYWLAVAQATGGDTPAALETLDARALSGFPGGHLNYLRKRWSAMQDQTPPSEEDAVSPSDQAESTDEP